MDFNIEEALDLVKGEVREVAESAHVKTSDFHEKYVSKIIPECGKYGDVAKFMAEMVPGVSEYNAIKDGDWQAFAIAAGIDITAVAIGTATAGTGYAAFKGSSSVAKAGMKAAVKEIAEEGSKKAAKEIAEVGVEKTVKEVVENTAEKAAKEAAGETLEKAVREVDEAAQIVKNKLDGLAREESVLKELVKKYGENSVIREALLRDSAGKPIKDLVTNEARRIDFIVTNGEKVLQSIEVTSETASKTLQLAKEARILEQGNALGGVFIKNPLTDELIEFGADIVTQLVRLK